MSESDFIREVDEELRDEQLKSLWDKFGPFIIGFALLIVMATAANKGWDYWKEQQAATSGDAFRSAIALADEGKAIEAIQALENIKATGTGGYPLLAEMRIASENAKQGKVDDAIAKFEAVAANSANDASIQDLARLRAASLKLDQGKNDDVILNLSGLMDSNSFRHSARELVMLAHVEKSEFDKALAIAERMVSDIETPTQLRQRAEIYVRYISSKSSK